MFETLFFLTHKLNFDLADFHTIFAMGSIQNYVKYI